MMEYRPHVRYLVVLDHDFVMDMHFQVHANVSVLHSSFCATPMVMDSCLLVVEQLLDALFDNVPPSPQHCLEEVQALQNVGCDPGFNLT